jgi:hydrogenase-4 component E
MHAIPMSIAVPLNTLSAGLVLVCAFAMVGTRQVQGVVRFYVAQSLLLAASSFVLASGEHSIDLWALGAIAVGAKALANPWVLRKMLARDLYVRREIVQAVNVLASLLLALLLAIAAELLVGPLASASGNPVIAVNLPIGLACVLIGAYSLAARREAIPQLIGILAMENGAFFAGIGIAPRLPLIAELAIAIDVVLIVLIVGLLTRAIKRRIGITAAATLSELKEEPLSWH